MQLTPQIRRRIRQASTAAAVTFSAAGWTWQNRSEPPTAAEIAATYRELVRRLEEPFHGQTFGRLLVTLSADGWLEFGLQLAETLTTYRDEAATEAAREELRRFNARRRETA